MRNSFLFFRISVISQTDIKIAHIFLESGRNRIFLLHFLRPHKQHRFPAGLLQFVHPDKISGHLPLHMTENMFCLSKCLYPYRCKTDLLTVGNRFLHGKVPLFIRKLI